MIWSCAPFYGEDKFPQLVKLGNFWKCLKPELTKNQQKLSFPQDFEELLSSIKTFRKNESEKKKLWNKEHKEEYKAEKAKKDAFKNEHNFCEVDGEKVACPYTVEAPGLIMTRGSDPRFGSWKYRVKPEDVVLNIVGCKAPEGWKGKVEHSASSKWVFKYKMNCGRKDMKSFLQLNKKCNFDAKSEIAQSDNAHKFDKTMKAIKKFKKIEKKIEDGLKSKDEKEQQTALITYLITLTGIRVGGERDLSKVADTVGASTLKVSNTVLK